MKNRSHLLLSTMFVLMLGACSSTPQQPTGNKPSSTSKDSAAVLAAKAKTEARYSIKQDVGPTKHRDMTNAADAIPKVEPKSRGGNKSRLGPNLFCNAFKPWFHATRNGLLVWAKVSRSFNFQWRNL